MCTQVRLKSIDLLVREHRHFSTVDYASVSSAAFSEPVYREYIDWEACFAINERVKFGYDFHAQISTTRVVKKEYPCATARSLILRRDPEMQSKTLRVRAGVPCELPCRLPFVGASHRESE